MKRKDSKTPPGLRAAHSWFSDSRGGLLVDGGVGTFGA